MVGRPLLVSAAYSRSKIRCVAYLTGYRYLDLQHTIWLLTLDDKLHLAPIKKDSPRVLDVGCGTGIWSIEFGMVPTISLLSSVKTWLIFPIADENPDAQVQLELSHLLTLRGTRLTRRADYRQRPQPHSASLVSIMDEQNIGFVIV